MLFNLFLGTIYLNLLLKNYWKYIINRIFVAAWSCFGGLTAEWTPKSRESPEPLSFFMVNICVETSRKLSCFYGSSKVSGLPSAVRGNKLFEFTTHFICLKYVVGNILLAEHLMYHPPELSSPSSVLIV